MLYIITLYDWMNKKQKIIKRNSNCNLGRKNLKEIIMLIVALKIILTE